MFGYEGIFMRFLKGIIYVFKNGIDSEDGIKIAIQYVTYWKKYSVKSRIIANHPFINPYLLGLFSSSKYRGESWFIWT